jgi:folate-dependent phosphoribosylglycinamide formyltransferase PurN
MPDNVETIEQPIRVVVFSGGPTLEWGVKLFLVRLEDHPEIEMLACICQSNDQSFSAVMRDLWKRRGFLGIPLMIIQVVGVIRGYIKRDIRQANRNIAGIADQIHFVTDIHAESVLQLVRGLKPDLGLIYGSPILKPILFEIPDRGTLGIHHGTAPKYRGKKTTFWEVFAGEPTAGVIIQKVNAGLDTGEIVKHGSVPIGKRSLGAVWEELHTLGLDLYIEAILEVKHGTAKYLPQQGPKGKLCRDPKITDIISLWGRILIRKLRTA